MCTNHTQFAFESTGVRLTSGTTATREKNLLSHCYAMCSYSHIEALWINAICCSEQPGNRATQEHRPQLVMFATLWLSNAARAKLSVSIHECPDQWSGSGACRLCGAFMLAYMVVWSAQRKKWTLLVNVKRFEGDYFGAVAPRLSRQNLHLCRKLSLPR